MITKQAMEANRRGVDPSGQELIEGSTIAGEISPVNHRAPWPLAPPIEGRVKLSDYQKIASKRAADIRYHKKRKIKEDETMEELEKLGKYSVKLDRESRDLKILRDRMEAWVDEENNIILTQLVDNYAGQNTEVQKARINFTGETSTGQDGLKQEMNPVPITSSKFNST
ncbi:hypothetical protein OIU77_010058 [Salix suchowensis]|uniref:Uncharacterized protein n=1 Tax=Salix suchowensis TaxID=1278906 RepID=A0ABQ9A736_9ROSI|nr:hypothetical protein OIU77_010058 [Salix suchowensis]